MFHGKRSRTECVKSFRNPRGLWIRRQYKIITISLLWLLSYSSFAGAQVLNDPGLLVKEVVSGLNQPTAMAFIGLGDILVLQKGDGRVRRVINGILQPAPVLDVAVDNASERGLLGIAIHPDFPTSPFVYLYYTESTTGSDTSGSPAPLGNRVYRYTWNGSTLVEPKLILDLPVTPGPNHNGGAMTFGPDGKLYVVIGELNRNGQLQNFSSGAAPDDTGVIFRINDDGSAPSDNPFFNQGGNLAKYFAYGIRNSFGLAFDSVTGKLWDTENGPANYDEVNLVEPGFNSGWMRIMGPSSRDAQGTSDLVVLSGSHYADPKFSWFSTVAPTAIVFTNAASLGVDYQNNTLVGDINNGNLYRFRLNATRDGFDFTNPSLGDLVADNNTELQELIWGTGFVGITDLKIGPDGLLYVLSFTLGKIFAISRFPSSLVAAVLPSNRSVQVGTTATAFATIINAGSVTATACGLSLLTTLPATFSYQTTNPATNQVTGAPNTPADIAAGAAQSYVFALTPSAPIAPTDVQLRFGCANTNPASVIPGLDTLLFSASNTPVPDIVALTATLTNDGIVNIPGTNRTGAFAVATVNVGASGSITASADTGTAALPVSLSLCETNPATAACISAIDSTVTTTINANATPTFGIFVQGSGNVPFDPATNRIFVRFKDSGNVTRGSTSVAVRTQ
jgi:glucose/arabinose dehydrogenase